MNLNDYLINHGNGPKAKSTFVTAGKFDEHVANYSIQDSGVSFAKPREPLQSKKKSSVQSNSNWGSAVNSVPASSSSRKSSNSKVTEENQTRIIVALTEGRGQARCEVGIAVIDISSPGLIICQISDSQSYTNTLTKINLFNPSEILFPNTFDHFGGNRLITKLKEKFQKIRFTSIPRSLFNKMSGFDMLSQLCLPSLNGIFEVLRHRYYALAATSALLTYVQDSLYIYYAAGSLKIDYQESEGYALIDIATADRLELVCSAKPAQANKYSSLLGILNYCLTKIGTRTLRSWILQPPSNVKYITERLDCVEELMNNRKTLASLQVLLQRVSSVDSILAVATMITEDPQKCSTRHLNYIIHLNSIIDLVDPLKEMLLDLKQPFFIKMRKHLGDKSFLYIKELVRDIINKDAQPAKGQSAIHQKCFAVKPGINGLLDVVRKIYTERLHDMRVYVEALSEKYNLAFTLGNNQKKGYHIVMNLNKSQKTSTKKSDMPPEFIEVQSSSNFFTMKTPEMVNLSTRIEDIVEDILKISNVIVNNLVIEIKKHISAFYTLCDYIAQLDVFQSLAQTSLENNYVRPTFGEYTEVKFGHHPLLNFLLPSKPVPNTIFCSDDYNVHIISGPNGSGKSIYIRQVMLLQIMAQIGCYVPAALAIFKPVKKMFARIYLDDNMEHNASSFVLEMKEIKYIMATMMEDSLIIIDELGRSTSVEEGTSLAISILEYLSCSSSYMFITTHFPMLSNLFLMYQHIKAWQMETIPIGDDPKTFKLDYKYTLVPGVTTVERYGIYIVRKIWPESIVKDVDNCLDQIETRQKESLFIPMNPASMIKYNTESELRLLKKQGILSRSKINEIVIRYQMELNNLNYNIHHISCSNPQTTEEQILAPPVMNTQEYLLYEEKLDKMFTPDQTVYDYSEQNSGIHFQNTSQYHFDIFNQSAKRTEHSLSMSGDVSDNSAFLQQLNPIVTLNECEAQGLNFPPLSPKQTPSVSSTSLMVFQNECEARGLNFPQLSPKQTPLISSKTSLMEFQNERQAQGLNFPQLSPKQTPLISSKTSLMVFQNERQAQGLNFPQLSPKQTPLISSKTSLMEFQNERQAQGLNFPQLCPKQTPSKASLMESENECEAQGLNVRQLSPNQTHSVSSKTSLLEFQSFDNQLNEASIIRSNNSYMSVDTHLEASSTVAGCEYYSQKYEPPVNMAPKNTYKYYLSPIIVKVVEGLNNTTVSLPDDDYPDSQKEKQNSQIKNSIGSKRDEFNTTKQGTVNDIEEIEKNADVNITNTNKPLDIEVSNTVGEKSLDKLSQTKNVSCEKMEITTFTNCDLTEIIKPSKITKQRKSDISQVINTNKEKPPSYVSPGQPKSSLGISTISKNRNLEGESNTSKISSRDKETTSPCTHLGSIEELCNRYIMKSKTASSNNTPHHELSQNHSSVGISSASRKRNLSGTSNSNDTAQISPSKSMTKGAAVLPNENIKAYEDDKDNHSLNRNEAPKICHIDPKATCDVQTKRNNHTRKWKTYQKSISKVDNSSKSKLSSKKENIKTKKKNAIDQDKPHAQSRTSTDPENVNYVFPKPKKDDQQNVSQTINKTKQKANEDSRNLGGQNTSVKNSPLETRISKTPNLTQSSTLKVISGQFPLLNENEICSQVSTSNIQPIKYNSFLPILSSTPMEPNENNIEDRNSSPTNISSTSMKRNLDSDRNSYPTNISSTSRKRNLDSDRNSSPTNIFRTSRKRNLDSDRNSCPTNISSTSRKRNLDSDRNSCPTNISSTSRKRNLDSDRNSSPTNIFRTSRERNLDSDRNSSPTNISSTSRKRNLDSASNRETSISSASRHRNLDFVESTSKSSNPDCQPEGESTSNQDCQPSTSKSSDHDCQHEGDSTSKSSNRDCQNESTKYINNQVIIKRPVRPFRQKFIPPRKLSAKEIREEFDEQDRKMLECSPTLSNISKYLEQRMNRPSVKQIQNATCVATFRKIGRGFEVFRPPTEDGRKPRRTFERTFSNNSVDMTMFSDKNAKSFEQFINSKETDFRNFHFKPSQEVEKPAFSFQQENKNIFDYYMANSQTSKPLTQTTENITFTPDGFYKQNKEEMNVVMSKYLNNAPSTSKKCNNFKFNLFDKNNVSDEDFDL